MTLKTDWYITLDEGVSNKELIKVFADEIGLSLYSEDTLPHYKRWQPHGSKVLEGVLDRPRNKHFSLPSQWKEALDYIKSPTIEVGKWYKHYDYVYQISEVKENKGFFAVDVFSDDGFEKDTCFPSCPHTTPTELTKEELKEHLLKVAEHKGYKPGAKIMINGQRDTITKIIVDRGNILAEIPLRSTYFYIYEAATQTWAKLYKPSLPKINGYEGVIENYILKYGCAEFNIENIIELYTSLTTLKGNRSIKSITLDSDVTITIDELKQIVDYCNE